MGQAHSATPLLLSGRQSCGDKDTALTTLPVPPGHCVPTARTDLQALPRRHVLLQLLLQQPRAAGSLRGEGFFWLRGGGDTALGTRGRLPWR